MMSVKVLQLPPPRRWLCDHVGLSVILSFCLHAGLQKNN